MAKIISACEQSGLNIVPRVNPPVAFESWLNTVEAEAK